MKLYNYALFALLSAAVSLHAMDDVRIEPFDYEKHGDTAASIFKQSFNSLGVPEILLGKPLLEDDKDKKANVVVSHNDPTQALGFIIYETINEYSYRVVLSDLFDHDPSKKHIMNNPEFLTLAQRIIDQKPHIESIEYLGVHPDYQRKGKGYGRKLVEDIEQKARTANGDFVALTASSDAFGFYKRLEYWQTHPTQRMQMTKPLNDHAVNVLKMVHTVRRSAGYNDEDIVI